MPLNPAASPVSAARPRAVGHTMVIIMVAVTLVALAGACALDFWLHGMAKPVDAPGEATEARTLVGRQMTIPVSWFRGGADRQEGFASEIDLRVHLPLGKDGSDAAVDVTLVPLSQARPSASLLDGVYLHQFMPNELAGPPGLVGKPLYATEGFEGETVWYDALSPNPFVAKCSAAPDGAGPAQCLRTVALPGGIAAVYAFSARLLDRWKAFDPAMREVLKRIGAL